MLLPLSRLPFLVLLMLKSTRPSPQLRLWLQKLLSNEKPRKTNPWIMLRQQRCPLQTWT